jgi:phosphoribosylformylglycinamidine (FGAM) synthase PurS component
LSYYGLYITARSGLKDPERQTVSSQSFPAGTELRHGSVVEVTLIDSDEEFLGRY